MRDFSFDSFILMNCYRGAQGIIGPVGEQGNIGNQGPIGEVGQKGEKSISVAANVRNMLYLFKSR